MKKSSLLTTIVALATSVVYSQTVCNSGRYSSDVYGTVDVTSNIEYGENISYNGNTTTLNLDFYEASSDTSIARPLIVWLHAGGFIGGDKTDADIVTLSTNFAKKGFVCASIDYRIGMWPISQEQTVKSILRGMQDAKAAVRFFYKDRLTTNTYKIDTTKIYVAGVSAGAIIAYNVAYLDKECEIEKWIDLEELTNMGGLGGTSGNPGYSSSIRGVVGISGALTSYGWIEIGDVPFCALHGTQDAIVPYNFGTASVAGVGVLDMDGPRTMHEYAETIGVENKVYSHYGAGNAPHTSSTATMDTTENFIRDFLISNMGCTDAELQPENAPVEVADLYNLNYCGIGLSELNKSVIKAAYPNPSADKITVEFENFEEIEVVQLVDLSGRVHQTHKSTGNILSLSKGNLVDGSYMLVVVLKDGGLKTKGIVFL